MVDKVLTLGQLVGSSIPALGFMSNVRPAGQQGLINQVNQPRRISNQQPPQIQRGLPPQVQTVEEQKQVPVGDVLTNIQRQYVNLNNQQQEEVKEDAQALVDTINNPFEEQQVENINFQNQALVHLNPFDSSPIGRRFNIYDLQTYPHHMSGLITYIVQRIGFEDYADSRTISQLIALFLSYQPQAVNLRIGNFNAQFVLFINNILKGNQNQAGQIKVFKSLTHVRTLSLMNIVNFMQNKVRINPALNLIDTPHRNFSLQSVSITMFLQGVLQNSPSLSVNNAIERLRSIINYRKDHKLSVLKTSDRSVRYLLFYTMIYNIVSDYKLNRYSLRNRISERQQDIFFEGRVQTFLQGMESIYRTLSQESQAVIQISDIEQIVDQMFNIQFAPTELISQMEESKDNSSAVSLNQLNSAYSHDLDQTIFQVELFQSQENQPLLRQNQIEQVARSNEAYYNDGDFFEVELPSAEEQKQEYPIFTQQVRQVQDRLQDGMDRFRRYYERRMETTVPMMQRIPFNEYMLIIRQQPDLNALQDNLVSQYPNIRPFFNTQILAYTRTIQSLLNDLTILRHSVPEVYEQLMQEQRRNGVGDVVGRLRRWFNNQLQIEISENNRLRRLFGITLRRLNQYSTPIGLILLFLGHEVTGSDLLTTVIGFEPFSLPVIPEPQIPILIPPQNGEPINEQGEILVPVQKKKKKELLKLRKRKIDESRRYEVI